MNTLLQLTGFLKPYYWRVIGAILLGAGTVLAGVGLLAASGYLISAAALQPPILDLMVVIVSVRFFGISRAVLRYSERLLSHDITFRLLMNMRSWFFEKLIQKPAATLMGYQSSDLLASITSDVDELQNYYVRVFAPTVVAAIVIAVTVFFLHNFSPPAAWATLGLLVLNGLGVPVLVRRLARGYGRRQIELRSRLYHQLVEGTQGIEEARLFGLLDEQQRQQQAITQELADLERKQSRITGLQDTLSNGMQFAAVFVALLVSVPLVFSGDLSGVMVALVLLAVMGAFEATQNLGVAFQYLESTENAAGKLIKLTEQKEPQPKQKPSKGSIRSGSIGLENVTFGYDQTDVLRGFSLHIPEATHIAVVGPTGSGKSTLVNLLLRFYTPSEGTIRIAGEDISGMAPEAVRASVSVVDQNTYLFTDTLRNNLLIANPEAEDDELIHALEKAELGSFLNQLPEGLDSRIGEHGKSVSGGERQRVALARAILRNTDIWVLDEPTANLDTLTEQSLIRTVREQTRGKTVLWITHRLIDMANFDKIAVLQNGRVDQYGHHDTLVSEEGWYRNMISLQKDIFPSEFE